MDNKELLDKLESTATEYVLNVKEAILRINRKEFNNEEFERFRGIGEKACINIMDSYSTDKYEMKNNINKSLSDIVDKAYDKNR